MPMWFLLTSSNPGYAEEQLRRESLQRDRNGGTPFQYFVPYQFLRRRMPGEQPSVSIDEVPGTNCQQPQTSQAVDTSTHSNQVRAALHRYVFVRAEEDDLADMLRSPWNVTDRHLQFFRDKQWQRVSISQSEMDTFLQACADERLKFEIWPAIDEVGENEEVKLLTTPFSGRTVTILKKHRTSRGLRLTVSIQIFNETMSVRLYDVRNEDIQYLNDDKKKQQSRDSNLVTRFQKSLIDILSRRINGKETPESIKTDAATLDNIYNFRTHAVTGDALRCRFLSMMLICARLRHDRQGLTEQQSRVERELAVFDGRSESRAATDVRAYLHVALFIATGQPAYRTAAKDYVRQHAPKSEDLHRLVSLITKRQALHRL